MEEDREGCGEIGGEDGSCGRSLGDKEFRREGCWGFRIRRRPVSICDERMGDLVVEEGCQLRDKHSRAGRVCSNHARLLFACVLCIGPNIPRQIIISRIGWFSSPDLKSVWWPGEIIVVGRGICCAGFGELDGGRREANRCTGVYGSFTCVSGRVSR